MSGKTVDRTFLQGESAELFRAAIKRSEATLDSYERRLIGFLNRMDAKPHNDFVSFAKNSSVPVTYL